MNHESRRTEFFIYLYICFVVLFFEQCSVVENILKVNNENAGVKRKEPEIFFSANICYVWTKNELITYENVRVLKRSQKK